MIGLGLLVGAMLPHYPGLLKLAAILTVAYGFGGREAWRLRRTATTAGGLWMAPVGIALAAVVCACWPGATPPEQLLTFAIIVAAAAGYSVAVLYAIRHRGGVS